MEHPIKFPTACVTIASGRVAESPIPGDAGRWFHNIVAIDGEGRLTILMSTECRGYARHHAYQIAQQRSCMFIDRSEKEPRR